MVMLHGIKTISDVFDLFYLYIPRGNPVRLNSNVFFLMAPHSHTDHNQGLVYLLFITIVHLYYTLYTKHYRPTLLSSDQILIQFSTNHLD